MKKSLIRFLSFALIIAMTITCSLAVFAAPVATLEDYETVNADQKDFYNNTYRAVYDAYLNKIRELRDVIRNTTFASREAAENAVAYLQELVDAHHAFYGDRVTPGTSRYDVPAFRTAMYQAADVDLDYDAAIVYCGQLKEAVIARVNYMNGVIRAIDRFENLLTDNTDDILSFAEALTAAYASMPSRNNTEYIDSEARDIDGSSSHDLCGYLPEYGYDGSEYSWRIQFASRNSNTIVRIIISEETLTSGETITSYCYKDAELVKGTSMVVDGTYNDGSTHYFYSVIETFNAD